MWGRGQRNKIMKYGEGLEESVVHGRRPNVLATPLFTMSDPNSLNPRPTKGRGVVTTPPTVCLRSHKNAKESDPGHLGYLIYILCGNFDEKKKPGGTP